MEKGQSECEKVGKTRGVVGLNISATIKIVTELCATIVGLADYGGTGWAVDINSRIDGSRKEKVLGLNGKLSDESLLL